MSSTLYLTGRVGLDDSQGVCWGGWALHCSFHFTSLGWCPADSVPYTSLFRVEFEGR